MVLSYSHNLRISAALLLFGVAQPRALAAQQSDVGRDTVPAMDPHAVQPERPTVATHAGTVAAGWVEVETGLERDSYAATRVGWQNPTVIKLGVARNAQLNVAETVVRPPGTSAGFGDLTVGLKWRLSDAYPVLGRFAVLPSVKFATGSLRRGLGTGTTDMSMLLISSHALGGVEMDLNAGYTRRSGNGSAAPRDATVWTASFGGSLRGPVGWTAECFGYPGTGGPAGAAPIVALLAGPTFLARAWLAFDAGLIVPIAGPQPHALYAGTVYNVGQLWGPRGPRHSD